MTARLTLPRSRRLSGRSAFARVFAQRQSASNQRLVVYAAENDGKPSRLGLSVSRRIGPAVTRNRVKRLLREAFRLEQRELPPGFDFIVVARTGKDVNLSALRKSLLDAARRAVARKG